MSGIRQLLDVLRSLLQWWVSVSPWEQAIRVRGGKHVKLLRAGIHLRVPLLDKVYKQSTRRRARSLSAQTLITRDGKPLTVAVMVSYRIADLLQLYQTLHNAEGTIQAIVMAAVGEYVTSTAGAQCSPAALSAAATRAADLSRFGLEDAEVTVACFAFVRTYRFITGEGGAWDRGHDELETSREDGERREL